MLTDWNSPTYTRARNQKTPELRWDVAFFFTHKTNAALNFPYPATGVLTVLDGSSAGLMTEAFNQLKQRDAVIDAAAAIADTGTLDLSSLITGTPRTADQLALDAFQVLVTRYLNLVRLLAKGLSITPDGKAVVQADVDAAYAAVKTAYGQASPANQPAFQKLWESMASSSATAALAG